MYKDPASIKDLSIFIKHGKKIDDKISEFFPLSKFGSEDDGLRIKGSKELLNGFSQIDAEKDDYILKLGEIELVGFTDDDEIILRIGKEEKNSIGAKDYNFTYEFLNDLFKMGTFSTYCFKNKYIDILSEDIKKLLERDKEREKQYRLIKHHDVWYLRAITSAKHYHNYDNHLALYLTILGLQEYANKQDAYFIVQSAHLSDSEMFVFFELENPTIIEDLGEVYFGVYLSNNELRERALTVELRYRVVDKRNDIEFAAIPGLKDALMKINHSTGVEKVEDKFKEILNLKEHQKSMLDYIHVIKNIDKISEDRLFNVINTIVKTKQKLSTQTRSKVQKLYDENIINNTMNLLEIFDKLSQVTSDVEDKIFLERIYHSVIVSLTKNNK